MRFVADESCAGSIVRALRSAGHDVLAVAEFSKGIDDDSVMKLAFAQGRVLITEDNDFGELVFSRRRHCPGVMLVRFPSQTRSAKPQAVVEALAMLSSRIKGGFVVVQPGRVRLARRPRG